MSDALRYEEFRARLSSACSVRYGDAGAAGPDFPAIGDEALAGTEAGGDGHPAVLADAVFFCCSRS